MMIYYLYIDSYVFRSYDHHQAEKYIATLGLLSWQRMRHSSLTRSLSHTLHCEKLFISHRIKGVPKWALQYYCKCFCVASVMKTFTLNAYKLSIVQRVRWWIVCTPLSINVFITLATQKHLEYNCKALLETLCITGSSHIAIPGKTRCVCVCVCVMTV
jgi:hypothetical protein